MFIKTSCMKFALAPLAAATILSTVASASPAPALQVRGDYAPSTTSDYWPKKTDDCECGFGWDKDRVNLKITQPNKDTVWKVGDHQKVTWEVKWDDNKNGGYDNKNGGYDNKNGGYDDKNGGYDGKGWQDGKNGKDRHDDKDGKDWHDDKDGKDWHDGKKCQWNDDKDKGDKCKTRLFLRKGDDLPFLILAEGFDIKSGFVDAVVPNVFPGSDYRVVLSVRELQINSEKFKIVKDGKDCKDWDGCKDGKDKVSKDCKDGNNGNNGGY